MDGERQRLENEIVLLNSVLAVTRDAKAAGAVADEIARLETLLRRLTDRPADDL